ncbi:MAG TPA: nuclear transport factor 2 family protein [Candidatus Solibacter sp.]|nr:nuclear transport factor 2 family protein [Candidatus Solibacter sp.]
MKIAWSKLLVLLAFLALIALPKAFAQESVTVQTLHQFVAAFNAHDLDAVMSFFADDCELFMPRGPQPWGRKYVGKAEVRKGLATRFEGMPDVHYGNEENWVLGNHAVSRWMLTGTTRNGKKIAVRGCDLLEFKNGKIIRKDSYWKLVEPRN